MEDAKAGDRIIVESQKVGTPARTGEIVEVHDSPTGPRFTVRWDDGHETTFWPHAGSVTIVPSREHQPA
jgi:hypothetical protein